MREKQGGAGRHEKQPEKFFHPKAAATIIGEPLDATCASLQAANPKNVRRFPERIEFDIILATVPQILFFV